MLLQVFLLFCFAQTASSVLGPKQLIVVTIPDDAYYTTRRPDIEDFVRQLAIGTRGLDKFLVVYSEVLNDYYKDHYGSLPFDDQTLHLVTKSSLDLWMRDFGLVEPWNPIKFRYHPKYLPRKNADYVNREFTKILDKLHVQVRHSDIALDGGNVVDNNKDKAIISERILEENKGYTKDKLKSELEDLLDSDVAFIPDPHDSTGHSDGILSFIGDDVLFIGDYDAAYYKGVEKAVTEEFPDVTIVRVVCDKAASGGSGSPSGSKRKRSWRGFSSAVGSYVNMLVTNNAVYVPQFDKPECDGKVLDLVRAYTDKTVVPIDTSRLSVMGGSVRCMSWQMEASLPIAKALIQAAARQMNGYTKKDELKKRAKLSSFFPTERLNKASQSKRRANL